MEHMPGQAWGHVPPTTTYTVQLNNLGRSRLVVAGGVTVPTAVAMQNPYLFDGEYETHPLYSSNM